MDVRQPMNNLEKTHRGRGATRLSVRWAEAKYGQPALGSSHSGTFRDCPEADYPEETMTQTQQGWRDQSPPGAFPRIPRRHGESGAHQPGDPLDPPLGFQGRTGLGHRTQRLLPGRLPFLELLYVSELSSSKHFGYRP